MNIVEKLINQGANLTYVEPPICEHEWKEPKRGITLLNPWLKNHVKCKKCGFLKNEKTGEMYLIDMTGIKQVRPTN